MITILRWIALPFSFIYQFIVWTRNRLYDHNILKSESFSTPTIVIGNLAIGGAGKSPMTEYLIRLLKNKYKLATLSRGYGRKTKGFKVVETTSTALEVGDEPLQFKHKFPDINVAVCEDRCTGVKILAPNSDIILLDDAFQHRKLKAGFNIVLFDFNSLLSTVHFTLPTGDFRDIFSSAKRADAIVITKCPKVISEKQKSRIEGLIRKHTMAPLFYSSIIYSHPIAIHDSKKLDDLFEYDILLFCGIANPNPLIQYLRQNNNRITLLSFPDHHNYADSDFQKVISKYNSLNSRKKIILTTEKDVQRIDRNTFNNYPLYYIPISINIQEVGSESLDHIIESYIENTIKC